MSRLSLCFILLFFTCHSFAQDCWQKKALTEKEKVNLSVVSDMYGYVRHFYPKPQNDKIHWTKFLMYAIEKTETAANDDELLQKLDELFRPLCPDIYFKSDPIPVNHLPKKQGSGIYVRSHYPQGRRPRIRDYRKDGLGLAKYGSGAIQSFKVYEKNMPVPDSMYCYQLKDSLYVFFPIAVSALPAKNKQCKQLIKEIDKIDIRFMQGNIWYNVLFRKEKIKIAARDVQYYQKMSYRLAKVIMLHHQIRHFYPYYFEDNLDKIWDSVFTDALNGAAICDNQYAFFDVKRRLMANVKDSHIFMNFTVCQNGVCFQHPSLYPDVEFTFIGDSLYVKNVGSSLTDKLEKWDRVITVNDEPFEKWLDSRLAITSASTHQSALERLTSDIFKHVGDTATLHLSLEKTSGEIKNAKMPVNFAFTNSVKDYPYIAKEIEEGIWHVNLCYSSGYKLTKYKEFIEYIPKLKNARGIIFDVRGYPHYYALSVLSHLIDSAISVGNLRGSDYFFPNQQNIVYWNKSTDYWYVAPATASYSKRYAKKYDYDKPLEERFTCPVVFLTDANAMSFGETLMEMVKHYQIGTIIGEPTAGTNGDVHFGYEVYMTGIKFTNHDDSQHHGIGVIPDIIVRREAGEKDNVLEFAKSHILNYGQVVSE